MRECATDGTVGGTKEAIKCQLAIKKLGILPMRFLARDSFQLK